jgi:hypothetical protein
MIAAARIIEDPRLTNPVEDWSRVRSPSRAARRRRQGHRQNIRIVHVPKPDIFSLGNGRTFIMHPTVAAELRRQVGTLPPAPPPPERAPRVQREPWVSLGLMTLGGPIIKWDNII